jgi:hypothetical protein
VGKSLGKSTFGRLRKRLEDSIKMDLKEMGFEDQRNTEPTYNYGQWWAVG